MQHVFPVKPPHLNHVTLAESVCVEIGHDHVIPQILFVKTCQEEEIDRTSTPAMQHQGCLVTAVADVKGVVAFATSRHDDKGVAQGILLPETIYPRPRLGVFHEQLAEASGCVGTILVRRQGIVEHIKAPSDDGRQEE